MKNKEFFDYVGIKQIRAKPMTRRQYHEYGGWSVPEQGADDEGYLVEYKDGGKPNDSRHQGFISWSPKRVFDQAYQRTDKLDFSCALHLLKQGYCMARAGWNGKGMFIYKVNGSKFTVNRAPLLGIFPEGTEIRYLAHYDMRTADGKCLPWAASQSDLDADDWYVVNT